MRQLSTDHDTGRGARSRNFASAISVDLHSVANTSIYQYTGSQSAGRGGFAGLKKTGIAVWIRSSCGHFNLANNLEHNAMLEQMSRTVLISAAIVKQTGSLGGGSFCLVYKTGWRRQFCGLAARLACFSQRAVAHCTDVVPSRCHLGSCRWSTESGRHASVRITLWCWLYAT